MPRFNISTAVVLCVVIPVVASSVDKKSVPKFEDYPATDQLVGPPKEPLLQLPVHRRYKTRLRRGILMGEGLLGVEKPGKPPTPNFAGAFYAITWGCGTDGCAALAVVDGRTGAVYGPPPDGNPTNDEFIATPITNGCTGVDLRPDSRLLFIDRTDWRSDQPVCQRSYYEWRDSRYWLIRKVAVKPGT